ncbi:MAG: flagellin [Eubacteriales bacterium]|nr:flagellin [Eubacteriales bacterium]
MIINTNMQAVITNNSLWSKNIKLQKNSKNLALGTKINTAGDDPAGMAISNKMKSQIAGLEIADRNTTDAISLMQTAEGAVAEVQNMVQRMRELAVQGATDTLTDSDRELIQEEINQLVTEIHDFSKRVEFNERTLLNDKYDKLTFQIGEKEGMELVFDFKNMDANSLGLCTLNGTGNIKDIIDYSTRQGCENAIETCDKALNQINSFRAELGAVQNRLEKNNNSLAVSTENSKIALSRIMDTDMAYEMAEYTKNNILVQSGLAMLAQANQRPNQLLSLLQ